MKFNKSKLVSLTLVGLMAVMAGKAMATTGTLTISAAVDDSLTSSSTAGLRFGNVVNQAGGGVVTVGTGGGASGTLSTSEQAAGIFTIANSSDSTGFPVTVTLPGSVTLTNTGGAGETMSVTALKAKLSNQGSDEAGPTFTCTMGTNCSNIAIGGSLNVGDSQAAGAYTGTATITFAHA